MALDRKKLGYIVGTVALLGFCSALWRAPMPQESPKPAAPAASAAAPRPDPVCALSVPKSPDAVQLFPTEEGLDEFTKAAVSGDEQAMVATRRANGGFLAAKGTKCLWLDRGLMQTKVRVTSGPHEGKVGWAATEWTMGAE
jgi:hypothetical protein